MHLERHSIEKVGWLRAAVLGQMTELFRQQALSLVLRQQTPVLREFYLLVLPDWFLVLCRWQRENMFQSHLRLIPKTLHLLRKKELETDYEGEMQELTSLYIQRGLDPVLAYKVAEQLMARDALDAHAREELGLTDTNSAQPFRLLFFCSEFSAGAVLPLIVAWLSPPKQVFVYYPFHPFSLVVLGYISSVVGKAPPVRAIIRIMFWSTLAMFLSMGIGHFAGQVLL